MEGVEELQTEIDEKITKEEGAVNVIIKEDEPVDGVKTDGPAEGTERWNEIYWKAKEGERKIEENETLKKQLEDNQNLVQEMRKHNEILAQSMEKVSDATVKIAERGVVDDKSSIIETELKGLREKRKAALLNEDLDSVDDLTEEIFDLKIQLKEVKNKKEEPKSQEKGDTFFDKTPYEEFINASPWFAEDPIMRASAIEVDSILMSDPKWSIKADAERLMEVKNRVESRFGYKPSNGKGGLVDRGSSVSGGTGKTITMSKEEQAVAKGFGLTNEQYAKQKALLGGN